MSCDNCTRNIQLEPNGNLSHEIEKDIEFIKMYVTDVDTNFLQVLLDSEIENPNRLETIMSKLLNIPNASELIKEFRRKKIEIGEKQSNNEASSSSSARQDKKTDDNNTYLNQIQDMFPDADQSFLLKECRLFKSEEDCTRFINTVMISGIYPKERAVKHSPTKSTSNGEEIIIEGEYIANPSSREVSSPNRLSDLSKRKRRNSSRRSSNSSIGSPNKLNKAKILSDAPEVIDVTKNNNEVMFCNSPSPGIIEVFENSSFIDNVKVEANWEGLLSDNSNNSASAFHHDVEFVIKRKRSQSESITNNNSDFNSDISPTSIAGSSKLPNRSQSFDKSFATKFLAEIIEDGRRKRRLSPDSHGGSPSTPSTSGVNCNSEKKTVEKENDSSSYESETENSDANEWLNEKTANLIGIFPETDPSYLREEVKKMKMSTEAMNAFVIAKLERNDMPTRKNYEKNEMEELQNKYTKNFSIEEFLKAIPDPWKYFTKENKNCKKYDKHSLCYLKSSFRNYYIRHILDAFHRNNYNLYATYKELKIRGKKMTATRRSDFECNRNRPTTINIQFLQEVAFIENEEKIRDYIEYEKRVKEIKFEEAKLAGSLLQCECCFDSEVMVEDIVYCPKDHSFCSECIVKYVEVEMGNGRCQFKCLSSCEESFSLACLQSVLKPELFSKVIQAKQIEEIRAAEIEDLVHCPFCTYATILPPEEKVMTCLNPDCLKESCRMCKEMNHIPLRCDEVEKSEDVKMRIFIENKMTEALIRTCYNCKRKFVKEDGCNKMTCTCGAKMCYICRQPVKNYSHFNGQGGTEYHKCPLYTTNDELHVDLIKEIGKQAKEEVLRANPNGRLLYDPTAVMPKRVNDLSMPGANNELTLKRALRGILAERERIYEEQNQDRKHHHHRSRHRHHHCHNRH